MVGWMVGWLEKAEIKPTQPSWSLSWAELGNVIIGILKISFSYEYQFTVLILFKICRSMIPLATLWSVIPH